MAALKMILERRKITKSPTLKPYRFTRSNPGCFFGLIGLRNKQNFLRWWAKFMFLKLPNFLIGANGAGNFLW